MERDRGFRVLAIAAICIAIVGLSIGYAALQSTLTISTKATAAAATWSVKFANLGTPTLSGTAKVNTAAKLSDTQVTIDVNLSQPSDSATYTFDVTNAGTIDAKLNAVPTISGIASTDIVKYTLTYADGTAIKANDELAKGTTKSLKLVVTYDPAATTVVSEDKPYTITATMLYVQK